ncbi:MAG TPA: T9SS type A sorting domain-containing protein [Candidatus Kapabacteria bacterium]|nr:T9SS type A sorting domain-containing protein [Candidatus Kapabacteria bacterium]
MYPFRLISFVFLLTLVGISARAQSSFSHDVSAVAFLSPAWPYAFGPIGYPYLISIRLSNPGASTEDNVRVALFVQERNGPVVFRDTLLISHFQSGRTFDTSFQKAVTPTKKTTYDFTAFFLLSNDENRSNDTAKGVLKMAFLSDIACSGIVYPQDGDAVVYKTDLSPIATFINKGAQDCYDVPVRMQIRRASNNVLVFQVDTTLDGIYPDSPIVSLKLPSHTADGSTTQLALGDYKLAVIARQGDDGDRSNDTAYTHFKIVPGNLVNDIGVDQILSPSVNTKIVVDAPIAVSVRFRNDGSATQINAPVRLVIRNQDKSIAFTKEATVSIQAGSKNDVTFASFVPKPGTYNCTVYCLLQSDEYTIDDSSTFVLSVGLYFDRSITSISYPSSSESIKPGTPISARAFFRNISNNNSTSDILVTAQIIARMTSKVVFSADTIIPKQIIQPGDPVEFAFPSSFDGVDTKTLDTGYYLLRIFYRGSDFDTKNDTLSTPFQIGITSRDINVALLILNPADSSNLSPGNDKIFSFRAFNSGISTLPSAIFEASITNDYGAVVYSKTITKKDFRSSQILDTSFLVTLSPRDHYTVKVLSTLSTDQYSNDDALEGHYSTYDPDISAVSITSPLNGQHIKQGSFFSPTCIFHFPSTYYDVVYQPVQVLLLDADTDIVKYRGYTSIPLLRGNNTNQTVSFPSSMTGLTLSSILPGKYKMEIIASSLDDIVHSNDTATTFFTITGSNAVSEYSASSFEIQQNFPNPFSSSTTFTYSLPEEGNISIRIIDITGRQIKQLESSEIESAGIHMKTLSLDGLSGGTYIVELTFKTSSGTSITKRIPIQHLN